MTKVEFILQDTSKQPRDDAGVQKKDETQLMIEKKNKNSAFAQPSQWTHGGKEELSVVDDRF